MKTKKLIVVFFSILIVGASFGSGFLFGQTQCKLCPPEEVDFSLLWETWHKLSEKYVDKGKLDIQKMVYGAISGMVDSLDDPYTVFLNPGDTKKFTDNVKGSFEGIGIEIGIRDGDLQVIAPLENTPAQKAGLKSGDKIIKINDTMTANLSLDAVVDLIRGPKGASVDLTIYNDNLKEPKVISIVRDVVEIPSLSWELLEGDIAYIKLSHFSENAIFDFRKAAIEILTSPAKSIILDLRNNPGGYLEVSREIAGYFLEKGQVVAIEDFGNDKRDQYLAQGAGTLMDYPVVILINEGSASASEILAGCLRDNRGIMLIGEKSFGKGSVQELEKLVGGSSLKVTIAKWLTPKGESITDKGLEPDIKVEMKESDYENDLDPQLDKAIEIIR
ncbi:MAG: S41 family peptidase [Patescibacteria group bacterium]|nr:S41 family peptidase [Patescibacteria group bacterium]